MVLRIWSRALPVPTLSAAPAPRSRLSVLRRSVRRYPGMQQVAAAAATDRSDQAARVLIDACIARVGHVNKGVHDSTKARELHSTLLAEFHKLREQKYNFGVHTYLKMMSTFAALKKPQVVQQLLAQMEESKVQPTTAHYTQLITSLGHASDLEGATQALEKMKSTGVQVDTRTMNAYLQVVVKKEEPGFTETALSIVDTMQKRGPPPDLVTFNTLQGVCSTVDMQVDMLTRMQQCGVAGDVRTWNNALRWLRSAGELHKMDRLVLEMERWAGGGVEGVDLTTYNTMLSAVRERGDLDTANDMLQRMKARGIKPDSVTCTVLIGILMIHATEKGDAFVTAAESVFNLAVARKLDTGTVYHRMMGLYEQVGDAEKAMETRAKLRSTGMQMNNKMTGLLNRARQKAAGQVNET